MLPQGSHAGFELDLDLQTKLPAESPGQVVQIDVDGDMVAKEPFGTGNVRHVTTIKLPAHLSSGGPVTIRLRPSFTLIPKKVNASSTDTRQLGVALHGLRLRAI